MKNDPKYPNLKAGLKTSTKNYWVLLAFDLWVWKSRYGIDGIKANDPDYIQGIWLLAVIVGAKSVIKVVKM